jgi:hypothetical protein
VHRGPWMSHEWCGTLASHCDVCTTGVSRSRKPALTHATKAVVSMAPTSMQCVEHQGLWRAARVPVAERSRRRLRPRTAEVRYLISPSLSLSLGNQIELHCFLWICDDFFSK